MATNINAPLDSINVIENNRKPFYHISHTAIIPPNTSDYNEILTQNLKIPDNRYYYNVIENVRVIAPLTGVYNIPVSQVVIIGGTPTTIQPGFYNIPQLISTFMVTIPTVGPGSYKTTTTVSLDLTNAPDVSNILGFPSPLPPAPATNIIPAATTSSYIVNVMNGYDGLRVSCNLGSIGSSIGQTFLNLFHLSDPLGSGNNNDDNNAVINVPLIQQEPSSIGWSLRKALPNNILSYPKAATTAPALWSSQSPTIIFLHIYSYLKNKTMG
jgi:hypothetical protein